MRRSARLHLKRDEDKLKNTQSGQTSVKKDTLPSTAGSLSTPTLKRSGDQSASGGQRDPKDFVRLRRKLANSLHKVNIKPENPPKGKKRPARPSRKEKKPIVQVKLTKYKNIQRVSPSKKVDKVTRSGRSFSPYEHPRPSNKIESKSQNKTGKPQNRRVQRKRDKNSYKIQTRQRKTETKVGEIFLRDSSLNQPLGRIAGLNNSAKEKSKLDPGSFLQDVTRLANGYINADETIEKEKEHGGKKENGKQHKGCNGILQQAEIMQTVEEENQTKTNEMGTKEQTSLPANEKATTNKELNISGREPDFETNDFNIKTKVNCEVTLDSEDDIENHSEEEILMRMRLPKFVIEEYPEPVKYPEDLIIIDTEIDSVDPEKLNHSQINNWEGYVQKIKYPKDVPKCMLGNTDKYIFRSTFKDINTQIANFDKYRGDESSYGDSNRYDILETTPGEKRRFYRKKITDSRLMAWHRYNVNACHKYAPSKTEIIPKQVIRVRSSNFHKAELIWRLNQTSNVPSVTDVLPDSPMIFGPTKNFNSKTQKPTRTKRLNLNCSSS